MQAFEIPLRDSGNYKTSIFSWLIHQVKKVHSIAQNHHCENNWISIHVKITLFSKVYVSHKVSGNYSMLWEC